VSPESPTVWGAIAAGALGGPLFAWRVGGAAAAWIRAHTLNGDGGNEHLTKRIELLRLDVDALKTDVADLRGYLRGKLGE
jgi:hypothetical protein